MHPTPFVQRPFRTIKEWEDLVDIPLNTIEMPIFVSYLTFILLNIRPEQEDAPTY